MILQALYNYYQQQAADPKSGIAPQGFEWKEIPFIIVIDHNGNFISLDDTRSGKMKRSKTYLLPKSIGRSGSNAWMTSYLLWDHYGYVLGYPKADDLKSKTMAKKQLKAFIKKIKDLPECLRKDTGVSAVISFYEKNEYTKVIRSYNGNECIKLNGCNLSFRLDDESILIACRPNIRSYIEFQNLNNCCDNENGVCLLTGMYGPIARIHSDTPISKDSKKIVSFQKNSGYDSYGKEQAYNAPTSKIAEFAYTTALSELLARNSRNKVHIGDITMVFWTDRKNDFVQVFSSFFNFPSPEDPDADVRAVNFVKNDFNNQCFNDFSIPFYVLGLGPNAARIAVKFWHETSVFSIANAIRQHYEDISIIRSLHDSGHYSVFWLMSAIAAENRISNISSSMASQIIRSIITGDEYPLTMLHQTILRIRSMRSVKRMQAGILKAYLNRSRRLHSNQEKEMISVSLDETNINTCYLLGRLFAVFEKIQEQAIPGINSSISNRYYGMASSTPFTVFPRLIKMKNHHLEMIRIKGLRNKYEKLITELTTKVEHRMPYSMIMEEQALFAIGYYHQKSEFSKSINI
jgi:CRISPR-associated protein Csd1